MFARVLVIGGLALSALEGPGAAAPAAAQGLFRATTEVVTLTVTVTDARDRHVPGLQSGDFVVLEDGRPQNITFFASAEVPLDVVLLIDTSSSMASKLEAVREAARRFLRTLRPSDRAAVVEFNTRVRILQTFTSDAAPLEQAIDSTRAGGNTALYTGLYVALDHFSKLEHRDGDVRKSAIVVLTDGEDTASLITEDDVRERARRVGVPIYFISLLSSFDERALEKSGERRQSTPSDFEMKTLSVETGARAFFPARLDDLNGVYGTIAEELSLQYTLAYTPDQSGTDGAFRRVTVRVPGHPDARPRTRAGYYTAPATASRME